MALGMVTCLPDKDETPISKEAVAGMSGCFHGGQNGIRNGFWA